ncbi:putative metal-binding motif-containing protein [Vitiosangium sp. GDMCC 1.1324]|uniref:putative metal-binding motif-containing protein n=1 Tax=Vitiosangium sp. (strain GDMCC 1.1324) TaxID=2138576 RepID=UPI00130E015F|nr:putative metal-binding motif-containing protein [Vitiosangium sp. GDMCC 1.1324]
MAGCREVEAGAGAVRVEIFYATFRPGCLTVTARDAADKSLTETQQLPVEERHSDSKTVAVFRKPDWGRELLVTASAYEGSCSGPEVSTSTQQVRVPEKGTTVTYLDLRAEDLDDDGFVSAASGRGTDCDDSDATVHPGAAETCDGKDSNCSGDEEDATDKRAWYVDADGDGYGNSLQVVKACVAPPGTVAEGGDCSPGDPAVHPGQAELRCDGLDEDCDGTADDEFHVGTACKTELGCAGQWECTGDGLGSRCNSAESPRQWYVDADGDGRAGTFSALACEAPPGAKPTADDCDDTSRFIGGAEVCDWLDNDCNGSVDELAACAANQWTARNVGGGTAWEAVTTYAQGKAWLASAGGRLVHVSGSTVTDVTGCGSGDWKAAWARPSDGRVFLGSARGEIATTDVLGTACTTASAEGVTSVITSMVGFERSGVTTVYAVTGGGHMLRWEWPDAPVTPAAPVVMEQVPARLRSVHGLGPDSLFAVGAENYLAGSEALPRVFRLDTASGHWVREALPADAGTGSLNGVSVVGGGRVYAVGTRGLVLERHDGTWTKLTPPDGAAAPDLIDVVAFDPTALFVLSNKGGTYLHRFNGSAWSEPFPQAQALLSLDALGPTEQWAAGQGGTLVRWGPP